MISNITHLLILVKMVQDIQQFDRKKPSQCTSVKYVRQDYCHHIIYKTIRCTGANSSRNSGIITKRVVDSSAVENSNNSVYSFFKYLPLRN